MSEPLDATELFRVEVPGEEPYIYRAWPRQVVFHNARAKYVLYGGAMGGAKSHALRQHAYMTCLSVPSASVLLLRRTFRQLEKTHIERIMLDAPRLGAVYYKAEKILRFPSNGSLLTCGHCETEADVIDHLGTEYDLILFDEAVTFTEKQFTLISSRARTTKPGLTPRVLLGSNPGPAQWVKERFIVKNCAAKGYKPEDYAFIPAKLADNPSIVDHEGYSATLDNLPEALAKMYRDGDWSVFEGQYFEEWDPRVHVQTLRVDPTWPRVRAIDWGYEAPGWCGWFVLTPEGRAYLEQELVFRKTIAAEVAKEVKRLSQGKKIRYTVGDTQMWAAEGQTGEDTAETFSRHGVPMVQANKSREIGWQRLRHWLRNLPDGKPGLIVSPQCRYAVRTLPSLLSDVHQPSDVDTSGEDHAADAIRYFVMSRPGPARLQRPAPQPGTWGAVLAATPPRDTVLGAHQVRRPV